ncbi:hypothetical protein Tco_0053965 [Tanacetum coccineum]
MMMSVRRLKVKTRVRPWRCGDPNYLIRECPKPPKDKNQRAFVGGSWSDSGEEDDEKVNNETCLVAQASSEVCSESSYFSDENSSIDDIVLDNEYDKQCKISLKIITKNKRLKATRNNLEKELSVLKEKVSTLEKNKGVDLECVKCHMLKIENEKLKEEVTRLNKFENSTQCLNEMLSNQKPSGEKLVFGFNSFEASSSGTKEIKFVKAQKKASSDGEETNRLAISTNEAEYRMRRRNQCYRLPPTTLNHPSSSHPLDDTFDENDDESFHSYSSSPSQNISLSSNVIFRVRQNPPHESHNLNTYLSETINLQTQQQDAHREGLRSIGQALKNMMGGKRKCEESLVDPIGIKGLDDQINTTMWIVKCCQMKVSAIRILVNAAMSILMLPRAVNAATFEYNCSVSHIVEDFVKRLRSTYTSRNYISQQSTRNRGKAIVTSSAPTYDPEPATVTEDDEMSKEKEIDKLMKL